MLKLTTTLFAFALASTTLLASEQSADAPMHVLVQDGTAKCSIVLPLGFTPSMEHAAKDLQKHLRLMSGGEVPIYRQTGEDDLPEGVDGHILITHRPTEGERSLGDEEYRITTQPGQPWKIRIFGHEKRGAMYGGYGLLQDVLGVRWFTSGISKVPKQPTIQIGKLDLHGKPAYEYREPYFYEAIIDNDWIVRNRINGSNLHVNDDRGGKVRYGPGAFVHTMRKLVPPSQYFESHPEYFALVDGKRVSNTQLCLTHPEVLKIATEGVKEWIRKSPESDIFSVSQEDNEGGACQCAECLKVLKEEGAESGPILRFVNAIAAEIAKEHPNIIIDTLAYNYSQSPPKKVVPLPNVRVRLCIPWGCKAHALDSECNEGTLKDIKEWSRICRQLYIWDYDTEYNDLMLVHPSLRYGNTSYKVLSEYGAIGNMVLGSYVSSGGSLAEMKSYIGARLMWDPSLDPAKIQDEYIEGVYGKAAPQIKEWIALIHSPFTNGKHEKEMGIYDLPNSFYLNDKVMDGSDRLLAEAVEATQGDEQALNEIRKVQMWVDYTRIAQIKIQPNIVEGKYAFGLSDDQLARISRWLDSKNHFKVTRIAEAYDFKDITMVIRETDKLKSYRLENEKVKVEIVPEMGGRIVQLAPKSAGGNDILQPALSLFQRFTGGFSPFFTEGEADEEYMNMRYTVKAGLNSLVLTGVSELGREVTHEYRLDKQDLVLKTTVTNVSGAPLAAKIWTSPRFGVKDFSDVDVSFETVDGNKVALKTEDFSINWNRLSKSYAGGEMPKGTVSFRVKKSRMKIGFDASAVEKFHVWNQGGLLDPRWVNFELHGKPTTLAPGESVTLDQRWTF